MQITAELDHQHIEKLQALEKTLKKNTSELIAFAIDEIFTNNVAKTEGQDAYQLMLQSGFIDCAEIDVAVPNDQTKAAMLDVRAKKNLENITLEQLQHEVEAR
jgi:hypothetical protein